MSDNGESVESPTMSDNGESAIIQAAVEGDYKKLEQLIGDGADMNEKDKEGGDTPLHHAAALQYHGVAELLLKRGAHVDPRNKIRSTPLHYAATGQSEEIVRLLLRHKADLNAKDIYGSTPLHTAANYDRDPTIQLLLQLGVSVDEANGTGDTALIVAAKYGCPQRVQMLLDSNANINHRGMLGCTALHHAASYGHGPVLELLIQRGADLVIDDLGQSALHCASREVQPDILAIFRNNGWDINVKNKNGDTPLHLAAMKNDEALYTELVRLGADDQIENSFGMTPPSMMEVAEYAGR